MTTNYIGTCKTCKKVYRRSESLPIRCTNCTPIRKNWLGEGRFNYVAQSPYVYLNRIIGTISNHKCDSRCTTARGRKCECSCGGANHGSSWV